MKIQKSFINISQIFDSCRISLSNGKYQVIKPPLYCERMAYTNHYLGKSVKGVYCAVHHLTSHFAIYILDESSGRMEWVFKDFCSIEPCQIIDGPGPWTLHDINSQEQGFEYEDGNREEAVEGRFEWDSEMIMLPRPTAGASIITLVVLLIFLEGGADITLVAILIFLDFTLTRRLSS